MATIYTFTPKTVVKNDTELEKLRAKLLELHEVRDSLNKEIRYTKDAIKLLEKRSEEHTSELQSH